MVNAMAPGQWYWQQHFRVLLLIIEVPDTRMVEMNDEYLSRQPLLEQTTDIIYTCHAQHHWAVLHLAINSWSATYYDSLWTNSDEDMTKFNAYCDTMVAKYRQKCGTTRKCPTSMPSIVGKMTIQQKDGHSCAPLVFRKVEVLLGCDVSGDCGQPSAIRARHTKMVKELLMESVQPLPIDLVKNTALLADFESTTPYNYSPAKSSSDSKGDRQRPVTKTRSQPKRQAAQKINFSDAPAYDESDVSDYQPKARTAKGAVSDAPDNDDEDCHDSLPEKRTAKKDVSDAPSDQESDVSDNSQDAVLCIRFIFAERLIGGICEDLCFIYAKRKPGRM